MRELIHTLFGSKSYNLCLLLTPWIWWTKRLRQTHHMCKPNAFRSHIDNTINCLWHPRKKSLISVGKWFHRQKVMGVVFRTLFYFSSSFKVTLAWIFLLTKWKGQSAVIVLSCKAHGLYWASLSINTLSSKWSIIKFGAVKKNYLKVNLKLWLIYRYKAIPPQKNVKYRIVHLMLWTH